MVQISFGIDMYACLTTFVNNQKARILLYDEKDKTIISIGKNGTRRFGSPSEHAHFTVYVQQPKTQLFTRMYTCKQNECGSTGNVRLKYSDIVDKTETTDLFTITEYKPHSSMVHDWVAKGR